MFASQMPSTVTANNPDSSASEFERPNVSNTTASTAKFCRYAGNHTRFNAVPSNQPNSAPQAKPTTTV
ncbi:hypothetical protein D3C75_1152900 [compost metagenome]